MLWLLLLAWGLAEAQQLNIESVYLNTLVQPGSQGNQTQWQEQEETILFSDLSFQTNDLKIGNLFYSIVAPPPTKPFEARLVGFVASDQKVYTAQVCQVPNQQIFNFTNVTTVAPPGTTSRRLLQAGGAAGGAVVMAILIADPNLPCDLNHDFGGNARGTCGGPPDPNGADQINFLQQLSAFANDQTVWDEEAYKGFTQQDVINQGITSILDKQKRINQGVQDQQANLNNQIQLLASATTGALGKIRNAMNATIADIAKVSNQLVQYTDAEVAQLANKTVIAINKLAENVAGAFANQSINDQKYLQALEVVRTSVQNLAVALTKLSLETTYADALATRVWENIGLMEQDGLIPFISDVSAFAGTKPLNGGITGMPLGQRTGIVDTFTINFVNQSVSQVSHSYTVTLFCDNFNQTLIKNPSYRDFLTLVGPWGCATNASSPSDIVNRCICWIQIGHKTCTPGGSFTSWLDVTSMADRSAFTLNPSLCQSNVAPVPGPWDGQLIDNINVYNTFVSQLCFATPVVTQNYVLLVSQRSGRRIVAPNPDPAICGMDFAVLFGVQTPVVNLPFSVYALWVLAYQSYQKDVTVFNRLIAGGLPNYVTYEYNPFFIMPDGTYGRCYTAYLTAVSPTTVPVYELTPLPLVASVTINAYATAPVCGAHGCIFPPTVSHQTTSTLTAVVPDDGTLPQSGDIIFGELAPSMTSVYDVDRKLTSISPAAPAREVTYNYLMQPVPDLFNPLTDPAPPTWTLDEFIAFYKFKPLHNRAVLSISSTQTPYFGGSCQPSIGQIPGQVCVTLRDWSIGSTTNMKAGIVNFQPKGHWQITAIIRSVIGEVVQTVFVGCPSFFFQVFSTSVVNLVVTNIQPFPIRVQLDITESSPFCVAPGSQTLDLASKQQFVQTVQPCGNISAQIFTVGVNGALTACQTAPITTTVNPALVTSINPFTLIGGENVTVTRDEVVNLANNALSAAGSLINILGSTLLLAFRNPNITLDDFQIVVNNTIQNTINDLISIQNAVTVANLDVAGVLLPLQQQFAAGQTNLSNEIASQNTDIVTLHTNVDAFNETVFGLLNRTLNVEKDNAGLQVTITKLIADIEALHNNAATDCNTLSFFSSIWCQLKQTFYWIIVGVVVLVLVVCLVPMCLPQIYASALKTQQGIEQARAQADMDKIRNQTKNIEMRKLLETQRDEAAEGSSSELEVKGRATLRQQPNSVSSLLPDTLRLSMPARRADFAQL